MNDTALLATIAVYGILYGLNYALVSLGFTLVFGVSKVLNLAYGALYMVTAYMVYYFAVELGASVFLSAALAIGVTILVGMAIFVLVSRFAPDPMRFLIATLLSALLLQYLFSYSFGGQVGLIIPGLISTQSVALAGISVNPVYLLSGVVSLVLLVALWVWIERTSHGRTIRAAASDPETAALFGIRPWRVYLLVVTVSSAIIALAAVLLVPAGVVTPTMWVEPFVIAFVVAIVGGLGKFSWALPAAFLISFSQMAVTYLTPFNIQDIVAFVVAIAFVVLRPEGLGGERRGL